MRGDGTIDEEERKIVEASAVGKTAMAKRFMGYSLGAFLAKGRPKLDPVGSVEASSNRFAERVLAVKFRHIPWGLLGALFVSGAAPRSGSLLVCLRRWDALPLELRAKAYIVLSEPVEDKTLLSPDILGSLVAHPEFLRLRSFS